jgi:hypothetical protein
VCVCGLLQANCIIIDSDTMGVFCTLVAHP